MTYFRNVVFIAALAGLLAGLVMTAMQAYATVPLIIEAESYENAAPANDVAVAADHHHDSAAVEPHDHGDAWAPADGLERHAYNAAANLVTGIGFALVLVAVSEFAGGVSGWRQGLFWGFAGCAVFTLAPGLGLSPELPGMPAAELVDRQLWWTGTAAATAVGLALIAFGRSPLLAAAGVAVIVLPHVIGAPQPADHATAVPDELHRRFVTASTLSSLVFWLILGAAVGAIRSRLARTAAAARGSLA